MHEADERIRVMLDTNPQINVLFDSSFKVIDCNPTAVKFMGFETREDFLDGFLERMISSIQATQPDGRPSRAMEEWFKIAAKEGQVKFETELSVKGNKRSIDVELKKIPYEGSFAIVGYVFDITNMREREVELLNAHEQNELQIAKLNTMVQATKIGLWDIEIMDGDPASPDNHFHWSDEFRQMLGFSDENDFPNTGDSWSERIHPDDKNEVLEAFERHVLDNTGKTPYAEDYRIMMKNGEYAHYRDTGEVIRDENGKALRAVGSLVDITETKNILHETERQRIEAQAANQAKSAFLSTMSHEIRTPMNAILGITEMQLYNDTLDSNTKEAFDKIYTSGDLLLSIINDILDLSNIEAGKLELDVSNYEIASLVSDTVQLNIMRIGSKAIEFKVSVDENTPAMLSGDELRIKQILNNLLSNAFKYTLEGEVTLTVTAEPLECSDDEVVLVFKVSDTGQGMTEDQVQSLFDEYSRFNTEANRATEGTGLGMSITNNLINLMNGFIFVESTPGEGSVFTVRLPQGKVGSETIGREIAENLQQFRTSNIAQMKRVQITREPMPYGSVLIVDDVETNIYVAKGLLVPYELTIDSAESGFEAIEKIENGNVYDIIFMDHMMPKMDGLEATRRIRATGYDQPIVALTANAVSGQADVFLKNGFDNFISKPIDLRHLNLILNTLIRDKQPPEVIAANRNRAAQKSEPAEQAAAAPEQIIDMRFAEFFVRDAVKALAILDEISEKNEYQGEDTMRAYIINVHGMKSALANVGNVSLSAIAAELEMAARAENTKILRSETPAFLNALRAFTEELKPKDDSDATDNTDEDKVYLKEKLLAIKTACGEYDEKSAEEELAALKQKTWTHENRELLDMIDELLLHSDFDEIVELIDKNS